jgi:CHAD domain-containing protein
VRKTRALLGQMKKLAPKAILQRYRKGFEWLGDITGPLRDTHVYLENMTDYRKSLPARLRDALDPLADLLRHHRQEEYQLLAKSLQSKRYRNLLSSWQMYLDNPPMSRLPQARLNISEIANRRIRKACKKVYRLGNKIDKSSPATDLHQLRIMCKKLRYLLEFFQSLYPQQKIRPLIKSLKSLQDNLGAHQDAIVQRETLKKFLQEMHESIQVSDETQEALEILDGVLLKKQQAQRNAFYEIFRKFNGKQHRGTYRQLFSK